MHNVVMSRLRRNADEPTTSLPLPLATGLSNSADPARPSLLDLPSEIRNNIYGYLLEFSQPVRIAIGPPYQP
jgi:hypothetical protein